MERVDTCDIISTPEQNLKKELVVDKSEETPPEKFQVLEKEIVENEEISINYVTTRKRWNQNEVIIDNIFFFCSSY